MAGTSSKLMLRLYLAAQFFRQLLNTSEFFVEVLRDNPATDCLDVNRYRLGQSGQFVRVFLQFSGVEHISQLN